MPSNDFKILTARRVPFVAPHPLANAQHVGFEMEATLNAVAKIPMAMLWQKLTDEIKEPTAIPYAWAGADLADMIDKGIGASKPNPYHNDGHFRDVLLGAALLNQLSAMNGRPLRPDEKGKLFFSALIHDLDHDGGKNAGQPFRLEDRSLAIGLPVLARHGVDAKAQEDVRLMVRSTDLSVAPKYAHDLLVAQRQKKPLPPPPPGYEPLAALGRPDMARTAEIAAMLRDSDILPSVGISAIRTAQQMRKLEKEWKTSLDSKSQRRFLEAVMRHDGKYSFSSLAGVFFNSNIEPIAKVIDSHFAAKPLRP